METKKSLKIQLAAARDMEAHYKELLEVWISELKFERLRAKVLVNAIDEAGVLLDNETDHSLIKKVLANYMQRWILDTSIHNSIIWKNSTWL